MRQNVISEVLGKGIVHPKILIQTIADGGMGEVLMVMHSGE